MNREAVSSGQDTGRTYGGQSLKQRRQMRRGALIDAGVRVYGNDGFRAATVKSICRQAGLTERYFYESFSNSEALFAAVYKELVSALERDQLAAVNTAEPNPDAMARAGLSVFFKRMQDPLIARILLIEVFGISGDIDRMYRSASFGFSRLLEDRLTTLFQVEHLPGVDARLLATGLIGSTIHIAMYWTLSGYREPLDTVVESSMALYSALARSLPDDQ